MPEVADSWRAKNCILDMFLSFYQVYNVSESSYRDFLATVLDHFEKTKIGDICHEETVTSVPLEKAVLQNHENKTPMAVDVAESDGDPKSEVHESNSLTSSASSSATSTEFARSSREEAARNYWESVQLSAAAYQTPVTADGVKVTEFVTVNVSNAREACTGAWPAVVTSAACKIETVPSSTACLLTAIPHQPPSTQQHSAEVIAVGDSLPLLTESLVPVTTSPLMAHALLTPPQPSPSSVAPSAVSLNAAVPVPVKTLRCSTCRKSFPTRGHLTRHLLVHTDARPFHCRYCPAAFKRAHHRTEHERTHTGERPYPCRYCPQRYTRASSRNDHELAHLKAASQRQPQPFPAPAPAADTVPPGVAHVITLPPPPPPQPPAQLQQLEASPQSVPQPQPQPQESGDSGATLDMNIS